MNIYEITGEDRAHRIWEYVLLSLSLMGLTFLAWYLWSSVSNVIQSKHLRRQQNGGMPSPLFTGLRNGLLKRRHWKRQGGNDIEMLPRGESEGLESEHR